MPHATLLASSCPRCRSQVWCFTEGFRETGRALPSQKSRFSSSASSKQSTYAYTFKVLDVKKCTIPKVFTLAFRSIACTNSAYLQRKKMTECVGVHQLASKYLFLTSCLATNFERSKKGQFFGRGPQRGAPCPTASAG